MAQIVGRDEPTGFARGATKGSQSAVGAVPCYGPMADEKLEALKRVPLFAGCDGSALLQIGALAEEVDLPAGREMIHQGSSGREFFVVLTGEVSVDRDGQHLRNLGPGDFLGEIALIDSQPRSASATTTKPSRLVVLGRREFHSLMDEYPSIQLQVLQALARRVRRNEPDA